MTRASFLRIVVFISAFLFLLTGCSSSSEQKREGFSLVKVSDSLYYLEHRIDTITDRWQLPFPVYQFQIGDIDGNGEEDALVGVVKATRFFPTSDRRLFIFKNFRGYVRPLWLGSRVGQPLEDFRFVYVDEEPRVRTMERESSGTFLVAEYCWRSLGLSFVRYLAREVDREEAAFLLFEENSSD